MKRIYFLTLILAGSFMLASFSTVGAIELPTEPETPDQGLVGGLIRVAELPGDQNYSRAAYSDTSDQYLVVFHDGTNNLDIKGRYVDASSGEPLGDVFTIGGSSERDYEPDVVYDPVYERFFVVWQKELCLMVDLSEVCNYVIAGRLVHSAYSEDSPFAGSEFLLAQEHNVVDLHDPRVAYNADDGQYLVVYRRGSNAVFGQMLDADPSFPARSYPSAGFSIRIYVDGSHIRYVDTSWGGNSGTFLVVWHNVQNWYIDGTIQAVHLHDTYQSGSSQTSGGIFKIAPFADGADPLINECSNPVVSYDPHNHNYLVLFRHLEGTSPYTPSSVHAQRVKRQYSLSSREGTAFPVETETGEGDISYYAVDIDYTGIGDTMQSVYIEIEGTPDPTDPYYARIYMRTINRTNISSALLIRAGGEGTNLLSSSVVGTGDGRVLVVWSDEMDTVSHDIDVVAVRLAPNTVYLPGIFIDN